MASNTSTPLSSSPRPFDPDGQDLFSLTENESATFSSSSDPCLDFFFQIVPDTPRSTILSLLASAWKHDPVTALKLIFHLRGVRGTGKSNKAAFLYCATWLHECHAKTLLVNLHLVAKFGYFKDLLEIVLREVEGREETEKREREKEEHADKVEAAIKRQRMKKDGLVPSYVLRGRRQANPRAMPAEGYWSRKGKAARLAKEAGVLEDREKRIAASLDRDRAESQQAAELRKVKRKDLATRARRKFMDDCKFAALHDSVAEIFASQLLEDKKALDGNNLFEISFASKWAPSSNSSYDLRTLMYDAIARRLFKKEENSEYATVDDERYISIIRDKMRKEFLVPLRRALQVPEVFMSANEWGILPYERVPSVAMRNYADLFIKHDLPRYTEFLGKGKVASGALFPHTIVKDAMLNEGGVKCLLAELQWKRMVKDLKESGSQLNSSLAVCDVSGSMSGTPMEVCIALGLLVAELSEEPWKNHLCTFSAEPEIHTIRGESLVERYKFTSTMKWDMNTDFQKVFSTLLELAKASELPAEKMIKRVFVFSDMEFDEASANPWETDHMVIKKKYEEAGYGEPPEIVFWNLRDSRSTPVLATEKGVALVSGFSKNLLKIFLEGDPLELDQAGEGDDRPKTLKTEKPALDPILVMHKAISGELFEQLRVSD